MPHVEVRDSISLRQFQAGFVPRVLREGDTVIKALEAFLSHDGRTVLVDLTVVEGFLRQTCFLVLTERGRVLARLLPRTSPEKTPGVKRAVAWVASWLIAASPGAVIGVTNLEDSLRLPFADDATPC